MKRILKTIVKDWRSLATVVVVLLVCGLAQAQPNANILTSMENEVANAAGTTQNIMAWIAWILMGVGAVWIVYCAVSDQQRLRLSIMTFVAAGMIIAIAYAVGVF